MKSKGLIEVRFFGDRLLLHTLVADGSLRPERRGGKVFFRLADIKTLAEQVLELESVLEEIRRRIDRTIGQEGNEEV